MMLVRFKDTLTLYGKEIDKNGDTKYSKEIDKLDLKESQSKNILGHI